MNDDLNQAKPSHQIKGTDFFPVMKDWMMGQQRHFTEQNIKYKVCKTKLLLRGDQM